MLRLAALGIALAALLPGVAHAGAGEEFAADLGEQGYLLTYLFCFVFGLGASFTPCVFPMIPIVVGIFGARDEAVTRRRSFALATAYVLGMGVVFSALGIAFAMLGKAGAQGQILANPYFVIPLVAFYGVLAASMFGAFELNLPSGLQQRLARVGGKGYGGAFAMGMVGGFTAAPCTGPFLAGLLGWVATTGRPVIGGTMLFTFALGMGVLFWVAAVASSALPKSGRWMESVKSAGGVALVVMGIYFLRPIISQLEGMGDSSLAFLAGAVGVAVLGLLLGAVHLSFHGGAGERVRKGLGVLLTVAGASGVLGWVLSADRTLQWRHDEAAAFAEAKESGKGVMIDFAASYCLPCKKLETKTFSAENVHAEITSGYVPLKFDVSKGTDADEQLQEKYGAETLPAVILLDAEGRELGRIGEFVGPDEFMKVLRAAEDKRTAAR